jgi:hypothetical protein
LILKGVLVTPTKLLQLHHTILEEVSLIYFVKLLFICKRLFFVLCTNPPKSSTGEIENGKGATHCQYAATPYTFSLQYCMPLRDKITKQKNVLWTYHHEKVSFACLIFLIGSFFPASLQTWEYFREGRQ